VLLAVSLWMRLKLNESPVFQAMKAEGALAKNPFVESFTYPGNKKRLFVALFGIAAGLTVIWYSAMFSGLSFLKTAMRMDDTYAEVITGLAALVGMAFFVMFGTLSDKVGRKLPIVWGYAFSLVLIFPIFWMIGAYANPSLADAARRAPVVVSGPDCSYAIFSPEQKTPCAKLLADLSGSGVAYSRGTGAKLSLTVGGRPLPLNEYSWTDKQARGAQLKAWLTAAGYNFDKVKPSLGASFAVFAGLLTMMLLSGATYGSVAALLTEMFPPRIRYSSMSIPYHIGAGYFGGFLPFISGVIVALTGNPYSGLWYTWIIVAFALVVAMWGIKGGPPRDYAD
jgi:hypothetical protein